MLKNPAPFLTAPRLTLTVLLFAAATLTGCNGSSENSTAENFPSLLGTSLFNGEPVSTLRESYTPPPDTRHRDRLRDTPEYTQPRYTHRSL